MCDPTWSHGRRDMYKYIHTVRYLLPNGQGGREIRQMLSRVFDTRSRQRLSSAFHHVLYYLLLYRHLGFRTKSDFRPRYLLLGPWPLAYGFSSRCPSHPLFFCLLHPWNNPTRRHDTPPKVPQIDFPAPHAGTKYGWETRAPGFKFQLACDWRYCTVL